MINQFKFINQQVKVQSDSGSAEQTNVAYNPYIHGTNSSILALLPKTDFLVLHPLELLQKYGFVPFSDEIFQGGMTGLEPKRNIRFGRLQNNGAYNKDKVIGSYAKAFKPLEKAQERLYIKQNLFDINETLVAVLRKKQLGFIIEPKDQARLLEEALDAENYIYALLIIIDKLKAKVLTQTCQWFDSDTTVEAKKRFKKMFGMLDLESLWKDPDLDPQLLEDFCQKWQEFLITPEVPFMVTQRSCDENNGQILVQDVDAPATIALRLMRDLSFGLSYYLGACFTENLADQQKALTRFKTIKPILLMQLDKYRLLRQSLNDYQLPIFTKKEEQFIAGAFPILLISESETIKAIDREQTEFCSNGACQLGREITGLATDTDSHRAVLENFLAEYGIANVEVWLFDDLKYDQRPELQTKLKGYNCKN